jgi:hypothetical protein
LIPAEGHGIFGPDLAISTVPVPDGETMRAEVQWVDSREDIAADWEAMNAEQEQLRQLIRVYRPNAEGWAYPYAGETTLDVYGDMPATSQAYRWLSDDLYRLHLVRRMPPIGHY